MIRRLVTLEAEDGTWQSAALTALTALTALSLASCVSHHTENAIHLLHLPLYSSSHSVHISDNAACFIDHCVYHKPPFSVTVELLYPFLAALS